MQTPRGRGRGRGRGARGRGKADGAAAPSSEGPSVMGRIREIKRKIEPGSETPRGTKERKTLDGSPGGTSLEYDEAGKVVAAVHPSRQFPQTTALPLIPAFQADIEYGTAVVRATQAEQSAKPRILLDQMKVSPIQTWPGIEPVYRAAWRLPKSSSAEVDARTQRDFFDAIVTAMETDCAELGERLSTALGPESVEGKPVDIMKQIRKAVDAEATLPPFWDMPDKQIDLLTDSEDEVNNRDARFAPAVRTLRSVRRRVIKNEQRSTLIGRSIAIVKETNSLAAVKSDIKSSIAQFHDADGQRTRQAREEYREWMEASKFAQWELGWSQIRKASSLDVKQMRRSFNSVLLTALTKEFPGRLRSHEVEKQAFAGASFKGDFPLTHNWIVEDNEILSATDLKKHGVQPLKILTSGSHNECGRLYIGNLLQMLGRPFGRNYSHLRFSQDFHSWLMAIASKCLAPLMVVPNVRSTSRSFRSLASRCKYRPGAGGPEKVDDAMLTAISSIGGASSKTVAEQGGVEVEDSDPGPSEVEQHQNEVRLLEKSFKTPEQADFVKSGFGPEHVLMRLGGGFGRLRNAFDVNRERRMEQEILALKSKKPLPMAYESSEEENQMYICRHNKYRQRFRAYRVCLERPAPAERVSEWPGSSLDRLKHRILQETTQEGDSTRKSKKRKKGKESSSIMIDKFDRLAKLSENVGLRDEVWRSFNFKPRVRAMDSRFDRDKESKIPLGFLAQGLTPIGKELQLLGIDTTEMQRRFGLTRLMQDQLPGLDTAKSYRRTFCVVIDESAGTARICPASDVRLFLTASPEQQMREFMWKMYSDKLRYGVHDQHIVRKSYRYRNLLDNNCIVWKEDLDSYQKLREKANEIQSHGQVGYLKCRPGTFTQKQELDRMGCVNFEYEYGDEPTEDVNALTESDISAVDYQDVVRATQAGTSDVSTTAEDGRARAMEYNVVVKPGEGSGSKVGLSFEEARQESRKAKKEAEKLEKYSGIAKVKHQLSLSWTGTSNYVKKRVAARYRHILFQTFFEHERPYRPIYDGIRQSIADRAMYETAWTAGAIKRASAAPENKAVAGESSPAHEDENE